ncbi:MAG: M24 family metallopeptidase [Myxacorys californica WJT36-NPBG1]|jgi:Xaa-Pro aminopeptidase|nr:M24 family metallopeptidase [Myxacorys californica WJT36-NPBG1]
MNTDPSERQDECLQKLKLMQACLHETDAAAIRLRGTDWFAWATAGASNSVLLAAETGVADVLVTENNAWILTDEIEAQRLTDEELPGREKQNPYALNVSPWADSAQRERFVQEVTARGKILSDRPTSSEFSLPGSLIQYKRKLFPSELDRYRQVGQLASEAMTEVLTQAQLTWTEYDLAGAGAEALWKRGLHPALTLAAGEQRISRYRHPVPSGAKIERVAMLVFCARGFGLYANLTRFVVFGELTAQEHKLHQQVREIEAFALNQSQLNTPLNQVYQTLHHSYEQQGYPQAIREHHQGGTTGYLAREIVANSTTVDRLSANTAIAWNPSLAGAKIEDTFVLHEDGTLENLTFDSNWPSAEVAGRLRPIPLVIQ